MPTIKNILIFVAIAAVVVFIYISYIKPPASDPSNLVSSGGEPAVSGGAPIGATVSHAVATDFVNLLLSVKGIALDDSIFSDPAFQSLDGSHGVTLVPDGKEGRPNPFAPIGVDVGEIKTNQVQGFEDIVAETAEDVAPQAGVAAPAGAGAASGAGTVGGSNQATGTGASAGTLP